jgi:hypothetical protein
VVSDLLARVDLGDLSVEEAADALEEYIDAVHRGEADPDWPTALGLSEVEATAYLHGADVPLLLRLRQGTSVECARCGDAVDLRGSEWTVDTGISGPAVVHIQCPSGSRRRS